MDPVDEAAREAWDEAPDYPGEPTPAEADRDAAEDEDGIEVRAGYDGAAISRVDRRGCAS